MLGSSLVVQSYVIINAGCPLAIAPEGNDHVRIVCGGGHDEMFEIILQYSALRALVELGTDALERQSTGS
jgi:hypothetical protein